ncbi:MAG: ParA family protein [Alphaproteobacteria bacterium]|nr:ParA family protein [Alphaproteobacteria bacterium]
MTARVVTVAQQKGGAGKTTLAAHLAVAWAREGYKVGVVDIDPQASLTKWFAERARVKDAVPIELRCVGGWRVQSEVEKLARTVDLVVVDSPPHAETESKIAVRAADLVLIPAQPSPMDLWATKATIDLARSEKRAALVVLNRMPARGKLAEQMRGKYAELGAPVAEAVLGSRVAFAAALLEGVGISEHAPSSAAAQEMAALAAEIFRRLGPEQ